MVSLDGPTSRSGRVVAAPARGRYEDRPSTRCALTFDDHRPSSSPQAPSTENHELPPERLPVLVAARAAACPTVSGLARFGPAASALVGLSLAWAPTRPAQPTAAMRRHRTKQGSHGAGWPIGIGQSWPWPRRGRLSRPSDQPAICPALSGTARFGSRRRRPV